MCTLSTLRRWTSRQRGTRAPIAWRWRVDPPQRHGRATQIENQKRATRPSRRAAQPGVAALCPINIRLNTGHSHGARPTKHSSGRSICDAEKNSNARKSTETSAERTYGLIQSTPFRSQTRSSNSLSCPHSCRCSLLTCSRPWSGNTSSVCLSMPKRRASGRLPMLWRSRKRL